MTWIYGVKTCIFLIKKEHVRVSMSFKGPILYCFSSISHRCQRSNNTVFDMHCPKTIRGPEIQLSKSRSSGLY